MKLALIASSDQSLYFFPELLERLASQVPDIAADEFFVPSALDMPFQAKQCGADVDCVFAFYAYDPENDTYSALLLDKLVNAEIAGNVKVIKALEPLDDGVPESAEELAAFKTDLAEKWSNIILGVLYDPAVFKPQEGNSDEAGPKEEFGSDSAESAPDDTGGLESDQSDV